MRLGPNGSLLGSRGQKVVRVHAHEHSLSIRLAHGGDEGGIASQKLASSARDFHSKADKTVRYLRQDTYRLAEMMH